VNRIFLTLTLVSSLLFSSALAEEIEHTQRLQVGPHDVLFEFSQWPVQAERSLDIIFAPSTGIQGLKGSVVVTNPEGEIERQYRLLPRFPRDRTKWGLDSRAFAHEGEWKFQLTIGQDTATLPIRVGPRPPGPPNALIVVLAIIPFGALMIMIVRAWGAVRPLRNQESRVLE
jgi:hypothetical protein